MAIGLDFGTAIVVAARKNEEGKTVVKSERNCFIDMNQEFSDFIEKSEYKFIKDKENDEDKYFVIGKDAILLDNLYSSKDMAGNKMSRLRRPMASMVINSKTEKMAIKMLKHISQSLADKPISPDEVCVLSVPSAPLDGSINTTFHSGMCESFMRELGYNAIAINEALAVVYATNPIAEVDGDKLNFTGIGISFGGGGSNGCLAYKGKDIVRFSVARGGDWIDKQVADVTQLSSSQVTVAKEKKSREKSLNLAVPNYDDDVLSALYFYYRELIKTVVKEFKAAFIKEKTTFDYPLEVVISGGTSMPEGFDVLIKQVIDEVKWPFEVASVRRAVDPLSATALGCLVAATNYEKKKSV